MLLRTSQVVLPTQMVSMYVCEMTQLVSDDCVQQDGAIDI
jgi:hypothetical protein